jgi:serine/threonine protein kinase
VSDEGAPSLPTMEMSAEGRDATGSKLDSNVDSHFPLDGLFHPNGPETHEIAPTIGRFSILHKLGQGGMGVVYLGYDARLDRRAAIKLLRSNGAGELGFVLDA